jgi:arsenate reductase
MKKASPDPPVPAHPRTPRGAFGRTGTGAASRAASRAAPRPVMTTQRKVLFLCTGNACRSPMAEGLLRHLAPDRYLSLSAGTHPAGYVHRLSVRVMAEVGIDISSESSKSVRGFLPPQGEPPQVVVSLCDFARRACPPFPVGVGRIHWPTFDPIVIDSNEDMVLSVFRGVRDEIRGFIERALKSGVFDSPPEFFGPEPERGRLWKRFRGLFGTPPRER